MWPQATSRLGREAEQIKEEVGEACVAREAADDAEPASPYRRRTVQPSSKASPRAFPSWPARVRLIRGAYRLTLKAASFRT